MEIFNLMFAEKILKFQEGTNRVLELLKKAPGIGSLISDSIFDKKNQRLRHTFGVLGQLIVLLYEFILKFVYVAVFMYLPYRLISMICPLVALHQERTIVYMFVILTTICGSIANNTLLMVGDRDYLMIRVMLVSAYMNFLGKLVYKMATDLVFFTIILCIFKVSFVNALMLCIVTICARPIGEMFVIICHDHIHSLYNSRHVYNGFIMAISVLLAYGMPVMTRTVSSGWMFATNPIFAIFMLIAGGGAMYFLWKYKYYRNIVREAMHMKREF